MATGNSISRDPRFIDVTGQTFGKLTVLKHVSRRRSPGGTTRHYWLCQCECGNTREIATQTLRGGHTKSCGCIKSQAIRDARTKHGKCKTPEYTAWACMNRRCYNPNSPDFPDYGGRGIVVCDRWRHDFATFLADMGPRPSPKHTIDRYPNRDGSYEPGNCRWATPTEQANNKRNNHLIIHQGETLTLSQWAVRAGIPRELLKSRLRRGWTMDRAMKQERFGDRLITHDGTTLSIAQWAERLRVPAARLRARLKYGWSVELTLTEPFKGAKRRLAADQVREIRRRAEAGEVHDSIAADFPVGREQIGNIVRRQHYQWVE